MRIDSTNMTPAFFHVLDSRKWLAFRAQPLRMARPPMAPGIHSYGYGAVQDQQLSPFYDGGIGTGSRSAS